MFLVLFFATGVGNASTFQMIPAIMRTEMPRLEPGLGAAGAAEAGREGIGGDHRLHLGDRGIRRLLHPESYGTSIALTGGAAGGAVGLHGVLRHCLAVTWGFYTRRGGLLHDIERGGPLPPAAAQPAE